MGLAIYYGIATWVSKFLTKIVNAYPLYVYGAAAIGCIVLLGAGIRLIIKTRQSNAEKNNNGCEETENVKAPAQLSPVCSNQGNHPWFDGFGYNVILVCHFLT